MHRLLSSLLALAIATLALPALASALLTPAELAARLNDPALRIVDIRDGKDDQGLTPYQRGHVPGALAAPYSKWRGPASNPGRLPSAEALTALIRSLGIDRATPVVVIGTGANETDFGAAARVYWTLKTAGLDNVSVLNGGFKAWRAADLPIQTEPATIRASNFTATIDPRFLATEDDVAQAIGRSSVTLLDARPRAFFVGETRHAAASSPGTLVGAKNVEHSVWFAKGSGTLLPAADVRRVAEQQGVLTSQPTVSFCNTGHWAATNWFVLSEVLGQPNVTLYPESVVAWSRAGRELANVPTRLRQFWLQLKEATGTL